MRIFLVARTLLTFFKTPLCLISDSQEQASYYSICQIAMFRARLSTKSRPQACSGPMLSIQSAHKVGSDITKEEHEMHTCAKGSMATIAAKEAVAEALRGGLCSLMHFMEGTIVKKM